MFVLRATPRIAALERTAAWLNSPTSDLSFMNRLVSAHTPRNTIAVTVKQNRQNAGSKSLYTSILAMERNRLTGSAHLNTYWSAGLQKPSFRMPTRRRNQPSRITRNTGMVVLRAKTKLSIDIPFFWGFAPNPTKNLRFLDFPLRMNEINFKKGDRFSQSPFSSAVLFPPARLPHLSADSGGNIRRLSLLTSPA